MTGREAVVARLEGAGCVAAGEEADELLAAVGGDDERLEELLARRERGEPLAWLVGGLRFGGRWVRVDPGVFVPRAQTELLAARAAALLPDGGAAVDLCTGSGAVAAVLAAAHPSARVLATDLDPAAVACARANGVAAVVADLGKGLPTELQGALDVVTAVVPYVPTEGLGWLPRDVRDHEPRAALDGGPGGTRVLERVVGWAGGWLRVGGWLLLELGGDQDVALAPALAAAGLAVHERLTDDDGDLRGLVARR